jgi:hypothetical protein
MLRMQNRIVRTCVIVLLGAISSSAAGSQPLAIRVAPVSGLAPCDITIQAFVEPDERNRSLEFLLDSEALYRLSTTELLGARAARTSEVKFPDLPKGEYEVRVTLIGSDGERGRVTRYIVLW